MLSRMNEIHTAARMAMADHRAAIPGPVSQKPKRQLLLPLGLAAIVIVLFVIAIF